jgi:hypothetical protein
MTVLSEQSMAQCQIAVGHQLLASNERYTIISPVATGRIHFRRMILSNLMKNLIRYEEITPTQTLSFLLSPLLNVFMALHRNTSPLRNVSFRVSAKAF